MAPVAFLPTAEQCGLIGEIEFVRGVEDEATASVLRDLGVTFGQGYLFGHPGPVNDGRRRP